MCSANKKPFADAGQETFNELTQWPGSCRFESSAGACTCICTCVHIRCVRVYVCACARALQCIFRHAHVAFVSVDCHFLKSSLTACAQCVKKEELKILQCRPQRNSALQACVAFWIDASFAGACTPFVTVCGRLRDARDDVHSWMGAMSGTLGFISTGLRNGGSFGQVLKKAIQVHLAQNYTKACVCTHSCTQSVYECAYTHSGIR